MHLDPITIASFIAAGALGLTRLLTTAKPLWDKLPPLLQGLAPALVLVLPQLAAQAAGVKTSLDLVNLLVLAGALILPGVHSHTVALVKPSGPSSGAAIGLVFAFALSLGVASCSSVGPVNWPKLGACAEPLRPGLTQVVADILAGNGDVGTDLATLGKTEGLEAVECAVKQLLSDLGSAPVTARASRQAERARAFLAKVPR